MRIERICELPAAEIARLIEQSEAEGFRFLVRLREEWISGANRFADVSEALFGVFDGDRLIAVGGITRSTKGTGRLRRCYVDKAYRRRGLGRTLVASILEHAIFHFTVVQLRTDTELGDAFYRSVGFKPVTHIDDVTHELTLTRPNQSLEPTGLASTPRADARVAPAKPVAHH